MTFSRKAAYNADGGVATEQLNNGNPDFQTAYAYDRRGRLTALTNSRYFREFIGYDNDLNGNLSSATFTYGTQLSSLNNSYTSIVYDRLGRLKRATNTNAAYHVGVSPALSYDPNGNILTLQRGTTSAVSYNYVANTNKIASVGADVYQHNRNGNLTLSPKLGGTRLDYDPFTQLTRCIRADMTYNTADERVLKVHENGEERWTQATFRNEKSRF